MQKDREKKMMDVWNLHSNLLMHMQVELLEAGPGVDACFHAAAALLACSPSRSAVTGSPCVTALLRRSARPYTAILWAPSVPLHHGRLRHAAVTTRDGLTYTGYYYYKSSRSAGEEGAGDAFQALPLLQWLTELPSLFCSAVICSVL